MRLRGVPVLVHGWFYVEYSYAGWTECECGFRPDSQEEMDAHIPPEGDA